MERLDGQSPEEIEEAVAAYLRKRFEDYMAMADRGELTRDLAMRALREEIEYADQVTEMARGSAA